MKLTHVLGRTWAIEGIQMMGLYKLDDSRCILIDSGMLREREALAQLLTDEGLTPVGVISTHIHLDHSINSGWLRETYGCPAAAPDAELFICRSPATLKSYFHTCSPGTLEEQLGEMVSPVDCPIPDEEGVFSFCGVEFRILPTPGHSPGHLCVITPDDVCCVGDAVLGREMLSAAKLPYNYHIAGMLSSAQRLKSLSCRRYIVAHREICDHIEPLVDGTCALSHRRGEEIRALIRRPMTWGEVWQAVVDHFSLLTSRSFQAALIERNLRSFVDWLIDRGELRWYAQRGMLYYAPRETE